MLLTRPVLERIVVGDVDLVFRLWRRPSVKPGGRLRTVVGEVRAGFPDGDSVAAALDPARASARGRRARVARPDVTSRVYRVRVSYAGADARSELAELLDRGRHPGRARSAGSRSWA
jgi:hypothetical protein